MSLFLHSELWAGDQVLVQLLDKVESVFGFFYPLLSDFVEAEIGCCLLIINIVASLRVDLDRLIWDVFGHEVSHVRLFHLAQ